MGRPALPVAAATQRVSTAAPDAGVLEPNPFQAWADTFSSLQRHGPALRGFLQFDGSHAFSRGLPDLLWLDKQYLLDLDATVDTDALFGLPVERCRSISSVIPAQAWS